MDSADASYLRGADEAVADLYRRIDDLGPDQTDIRGGGLGWIVHYLREVGRRRRFLREFGWSAPTARAVAEIRDFVGGRKLLEVGAGAGLWAYLLNNSGVDVTATDDFSWMTPRGAGAATKPPPSGFSVAMGRFFPVEPLSALAAVAKYSDREVILLCWPPPDKPMAYEALKAFSGDRLVYVGDLGATADSAFRDELAVRWQQQRALPLASWPGMHDAVYLYEKRFGPASPGRGAARPNPHRF